MTGRGWLPCAALTASWLVAWPAAGHESFAVGLRVEQGMLVPRRFVGSDPNRLESYGADESVFTVRLTAGPGGATSDAPRFAAPDNTFHPCDDEWGISSLRIALTGPLMLYLNEQFVPVEYRLTITDTPRGWSSTSPLSEIAAPFAPQLALPLAAGGGLLAPVRFTLSNVDGSRTAPTGIYLAPAVALAPGTPLTASAAFFFLLEFGRPVEEYDAALALARAGHLPAPAAGGLLGAAAITASRRRGPAPRSGPPST